MSRALFRPLAAVWLLAAFIGCAGPQSQFVPTASEKTLFGLMVQRLEIAKEVAWFKYPKQLPVSDPARESQLLDALVIQGEAHHVPEQTVRTFFAAQIRASCEVQEERMAAWNAGRPQPTQSAADLKKVIRPKLDQISQEMLLALQDPLQKGFADWAQSRLRTHGFSDRVSRLAVKPLP